ncbi:ClpXP protease specificity-enhancing factor [Rubrivivax benzoatilyticus]|uniref:ClpXP protease specificity-enhancing factor n=1 Tax=Rubrivivax benzoatilyticus TaxID=316997 RepID=A0ABX0HQ63_9BURK|nr:ClpXP protease specificity-enhancing factor [Rubrivivax benzoatilyticus]EGJ10054.1 ClpXP protease specificity-enhancing factor [Rubrivivax benzoatilyticus JA2 = ATCC BAA-35]NHK97214.1 ClpXP protease specificity-enhancing factor [Rubrivivax benzoatilyticus]NHL23091.1 ClpXP protease specificity-enhancing factor [Rubrivivax benzoatilyticus]
MSATSDNQGSSTRPYLLRALHDWCTDNGFTPYLAVYVDASVQVPMEYVKNHEIVLNVGFEATSGLKLGNEFIEFKARFGGVPRDIVVPVDHVVAIYARENGQGMAFPAPAEAASPAAAAAAEPARAPTPLRSGLRLASESGEPPAPADHAPPPDDSPEPGGSGGRPSLKRIK